MRTTDAIAFLASSLAAHAIAGTAAAQQPPAPGRGYAPAPAYWAPQPAPEASLERNSTGMMVTGIVLSGLGVVNGSIGVAILAGDGHCVETCGFNVLIGAPVASLGAILLGVGIPLTAVGARTVRRDEEDARAPVLLIGAGTGGLRWRF